MIEVGDSGLFFSRFRGNADEILLFWFDFLTMVMFLVKHIIIITNIIRALAECLLTIHSSGAQTAHLHSTEYDHYGFYYPTHFFNIRQMSISTYSGLDCAKYDQEDVVATILEFTDSGRNGY